MKHNLLTCYDYQDQPAGSFRKQKALSLRNEVCCWISYVVDTLATIAITGCTVFCCYLALTML